VVLSFAPVALCSGDAAGSLVPAHTVSFEFGAHALGRGSVRADHVALGEGAASLTLPAGSFDGAEIRSVERFGYGTYSAG